MLATRKKKWEKKIYVVFAEQRSEQFIMSHMKATGI